MNRTPATGSGKSRRMKARALTVFGSLGVVASVLAACILADPLPEQRSLPTRRPSIVHASVSPAESQPLMDLHDTFIVPLQLYNPTIPFEWRVFVDYDPLQKNAYEIHGSGGGTSSTADYQIIPFSIGEEKYGDRCHTFEFLVAFSFIANHTADAAGADSISWFYVPNGDFSKCTSYDAGVSDGSSDSGADSASDAAAR